jgi:hypothetical protein
MWAKSNVSWVAAAAVMYGMAMQADAHMAMKTPVPRMSPVLVGTGNPDADWNLNAPLATPVRPTPHRHSAAACANCWVCRTRGQT